MQSYKIRFMETELEAFSEDKLSSLDSLEKERDELLEKLHIGVEALAKQYEIPEEEILYALSADPFLLTPGSDKQSTEPDFHALDNSAWFRIIEKKIRRLLPRIPGGIIYNSAAERKRSKLINEYICGYLEGIQEAKNLHNEKIGQLEQHLDETKKKAHGQLIEYVDDIAALLRDIERLRMEIADLIIISDTESEKTEIGK